MTQHPEPGKRSRKRWFTAWAIVGVVTGFVVSLFVPNVYQASTTILVIPQRVPTDMVRSTIVTSAAERLNIIAKVVLSRTRLERVIQEFNLYGAERKRLYMEDVVALMRKEISIDIPPPSESRQVLTFSVAFQATNPRTAMRVTERLASLFVVENLEDRELAAGQTEQFIKAQVEDSKRRLMETDKARLANTRSAAPWDQAEHEVLVENYKQLLSNAEAATMAIRLEQRQIAEQFKVIDGARLPERPIGPSRFPYVVLGALGGTATGLLLSLIATLWRRRRAIA